MPSWPALVLRSRQKVPHSNFVCKKKRLLGGVYTVDLWINGSIREGVNWDRERATPPKYKGWCPCGGWPLSGADGALRSGPALQLVSPDLFFCVPFLPPKTPLFCKIGPNADIGGPRGPWVCLN